MLFTTILPVMFITVVSAENGEGAGGGQNDATTTTVATKNEMCDCECDFFDKLALLKEEEELKAEKTAAMTETEIEEVKQNETKQLNKDLTKTKQALSVNSSSLSTKKAKKISARDDRPSSAAIGALGVTFLGLVLGSIVLLDLITIKQRLNK